MKKALIFSLLLLFLFNSMGYYLLFELHKNRIKTEMRTKIRNQREIITILTIDNVARDKEFIRIDKKEFRYKGAMYDIIREIKKGQKTIFVCLHDTRESKLFAGLKRETQNKSHLARWDQVTLFTSSIPAFDMKSFQLTDLVYARVYFAISSPFLGTWGPPPKTS